MKILSTQTTEEVKKTFYLKVSYKGVEFTVVVYTINGKIVGNEQSGLHTAYLNYFNHTLLSLRKKHFNRIKKYVESLK